MVEAGVRGFKGFMIESGVEVCGTHGSEVYACSHPKKQSQEFPCISDKDIIKAMTELHASPNTNDNIPPF